MKVPVVSGIFKCLEEILEFTNGASDRRIRRVILSADKLVENLDGVPLPDKALHYQRQYIKRRKRLT